MFSTNEMPSPYSIFTAMASITASIMFFQSMINQILPKQVTNYLISILQHLFQSHYPHTTITFVFEKGSEYGTRNQIYDAARVYITTLKRSPETKRLRVRKSPKEKPLIFRLDDGERVTDFFEGIELEWRFVLRADSDKDTMNGGGGGGDGYEKRLYELSFNKKHEEKVSMVYIPFVLERAKRIEEENRFLKMHTLNIGFNGPCVGVNWQSVNLEHPATFETLAMKESKKISIMEDLDRFVRRKDFYKKVGRAWKRGYLLYGPPGTGKSSLVAAMANHLKFDIYDLQLGNVQRDCDLRRLLLATDNRSILVIEDIDCSVRLPDRLNNGGEQDYQTKSNNLDNPNDKKSVLTLSGLLNFIDGLWSSCGDERIIIFTTNHKEKLEPALLRPGRMDVHIHMGYCTYEAFKQLATNYLEISGDHHNHKHLYSEIKALLEQVQVTPAQVAEEFLKHEDADSALDRLLSLLRRIKNNVETGHLDQLDHHYSEALYE
ncbi:AAA-ATPase At5g17760 [Cannabis sativa]|uniref:AAA-ATPase At5g17760 n=1 Tax=Cannabis sativa TaxID=3483 RepID=UPI0029CA7086|nr:AAA-ATPase At5g17760 [Cannabis sativa]